MSVAFDAVSTMPILTAASSASWTHTPSGTPTAVGIGYYGWDNGFAGSATITYGGTSVPQVQKTTDSTGDTCGLHGLANPSSGAQTINLTYSATIYTTGGAVTVTGSDTTTCFSNSNTASATSSTLAVAVTSAAGELCFAVGGQDSAPSALVPDASITEVWNQSNSGERGVGGYKAGAASVTIQWTAANSPWAMCGGSFKAAAAGGITTAIASTETGDTFAGAAAVTLPTSTIASTETGDSLVASVTVTQPALSIAATEDGDSFVAQAVVVGGTLTSDIVVTETGDSMAGVLVGVSTKQGGDDVPRGKSPDRGFDLKAWQKKQRVYDDIEITARDTYQALTGTAKEKAAVVLEKHVQNNQPKRTDIPLEVAIDWAAASKDLEARASLREMLGLQDEEKMIVEWLFNE